MNASIAHVAGYVDLAGAAVALAALVFLHLAPTGLSPLRNAVSQYGISAYRGGYRAATIALGVAGLAAAVGIYFGLQSHCPSVVALLGLFGVLRLVISWFPMDRPGRTRTRTGALHGLIALSTFAAVAIAAVRLSTILSSSGQWQTIEPVVRDVSWALVVLALAMAVSIRMSARRNGERSGSVFGAIERLFYLAVFAFVGTVGVGLVASVH